MADCIDLRPICKERRWKWRFEESFKAEHMSSANPDAPWYVEIMCKNGEIYPLGGSDLAAHVEGRPNMPSRLLKAEGVIPHQGNAVFAFRIETLDRVAEVMRPKKLSGRKATEEDLERLAKTAFRGGRGAQESTKTERDE